jgi:hypothetical protein
MALPVLFIAAVYLLSTGRWGSYVAIPGLPVYIGDLFIIASIVQVVVLRRGAGVGLWDGLRDELRRTPLVLLLALSLLGWSLLRLLVGAGALIDDPMTALRDFAPYAYAVAALLSFAIPSVDDRLSRRLIYAGLTFHVAWILVPGWLPGDPFSGLLLGGAPIFTTRPDIDSAVLGIGIALALKDLLLSERQPRVRERAALIALAVASAYAVSTQPTRAGLLACTVVVCAVLVVWWRHGRRYPHGTPGHGRRAVAMAVGLGAVAVLVLFSPPGQRLLDGLSSGGSQAAGTIKVREATWRGVSDYVTVSPWRTGAGVGFGPDFIEASGTGYALEGTEYKDVRSPHNYVVGTLARLGLAGALLAILTIVLGAVAAVRVLTRNPGTTTTFAALALLALPVTALLGVVLESPFGAIPYFWALGHVAYRIVQGSDGSETGSNG